MIKFRSILIFYLSLAACNAPSQNADKNNASGKETTAIFSPGVDSTYPFADTYAQYSITGYYNEDDILDTAFLLRHKRVNTKAALYIKHGGTTQHALFRDGKPLGQDFPNFHWVGQFEVIEKGSVIWNNVINGEIVSEDQVPDSKKIRLRTDAIFMHEDEGGGGGIVYYSQGRYRWVQQD